MGIIFNVRQYYFIYCAQFANNKSADFGFLASQPINLLGIIQLHDCEL